MIITTDIYMVCGHVRQGIQNGSGRDPEGAEQLVTHLMWDCSTPCWLLLWLLNYGIYRYESQSYSFLAAAATCNQ
jgi:hypothetical protein